MDNRTIYKTEQDCLNLEVSNNIYVVDGEGYSIENISSSYYYGVKHFNSGYPYHFCSGGLFTFADLVKAVKRRGLTAIIGDGFESDSFCGEQPDNWAQYTIRPTFKVGDILCICTGMVDGIYSFLPISEFIKQLKKKKYQKDEYDRQRYLDGDY